MEVKLNKVKKILLSFSVLMILSILTVYLVNYIQLQKPFSEVIESDSRNSGIEMSVRYAYYISPSTLVIDVDHISAQQSPADVFRVFLQYASALSSKKFERVELSSKGKTKFILKGDYFQQLGEEYGKQNPVYTMRTFSENLYDIEGMKSFGSWTGGVLGVLGKQMEDFAEFHKKWYIEDM